MIVSCPTDTASAPADCRIRLYWLLLCIGDGDLLYRIKTVMEGNKQEGGGVAAMALLDYLSSSKKIRGILRNILIRVAFVLHKPCRGSLPTRLVVEVFPLELLWKSFH